jgi:hypothetical protein
MLGGGMLGGGMLGGGMLGGGFAWWWLGGGFGMTRGSQFPVVS